MAASLDLAFAATLEPERAVAYLRGKGLGVSWDWHDTWEAAHARAFVVAKAAKLDVLSTLREAVDAALAKGLTRRQFVRELEPRLRALGWWGRRVVGGPDGEDGEVQLGSPRRLKTIYDTNMRTAYAASRFRAQSANAGSRPYFQYLSMDDDRVRPSHRAMSGRVYRHDDPIWRTHYPPNGFNCRCTVRALTARQARGMGVYRTGTSDGGVLRPTEQVVGVDRRTGDEIRRPATEYVFERGAGRLVTLTPDPGWNYNPGRTGAPFGPITGDPTRLLPLAGGQTTAQQLDLPALPRLRRPPTPLPPAPTAAAAAEQIRRAIAGRAGRLVRLDDGSGTTAFALVPTPAGQVALTAGFLQHVVARRRDRERFARQIVPTLSDPFEVWLQPTVRDDGRLTYELAYVGDHGDYVVAQEHRDATVGWTFFRPSRIDSRRRGYLLYRR